MLRHGIIPPKEIVRPESARIALQGIQPKGLDERERSISPVGTTIKNIFPFYLKHEALGGRERLEAVTAEDLTNRDLEKVNRDVRLNADRVYQDIFEEYSSIADLNRNLQPAWITEAREALRSQQEMVIADLEKKYEQAPPTASDEFMYQDKNEARRELEVARRILQESPQPVRSEDLRYRSWNLLPYERYRGSDEGAED